MASCAGRRRQRAKACRPGRRTAEGTGARRGCLGVAAIDTLARLGYPRIDAENVPFDPRLHEVVSVVESDEVPPGTVLTVLRPGYGGPDNTLRPAAVVVSRAVTPDRG
jgi:hypothetical protein